MHAIQLKWICKTIMMDKEDPKNYSKCMPLIGKMFQNLELDVNANDSESLLLRDQARAVLLRSKGLLVAWWSPRLLTELT
mgnify:CR=1 FL=1